MLSHLPRRFFVLSAIFFVVLVGAIFFPRHESSAVVVFEGGKAIGVEVAQTPSEHERGLSGHAPLDDQKGMLFVWDTSASRTFWMKGMTFPIDIVWVNKGRIIGVTRQVPVPEEGEVDLPLYPSPASADAVLEVAGGFADRYEVAVGQRIEVYYDPRMYLQNR